MATPPLPDISCVRVRLIYDIGTGQEAGNRFYLSYSGSAPTGANCATLATDVANSWNTDIAPVVAAVHTLGEVDVLDIATTSGLSGQWTGSHAGGMAGTALPAQCATDVEFGIARRYRGGKPRIYLPGPDNTAQATGRTYNSTFLANVNAGVLAFFTALEALSIGSMGTLAHINLSYYKGYQNVEIPGQRAYAQPLYRTPNAIHDVITGYFAKAEIGSQRRRRTSTTP